ncbi:MAG: recombinase family protein [Bacteriovoracaceae bacterium]|nr:recombinase family protein [Bacteriovoracaceae bacterium]
MKVAIYTRTSTDRQQSGLEAQKRALEEFCKARGITEYLVFEDFGVSGTKNSRPELDRLMVNVRNGSVNTVIVYSFSRFARSTKFLLDTLEEFGKLKVNFISLSENVDLSTAIGKAMFTIISAIATLERDLISERVRNGLVNARAKGKKIGRPVKVNQELIVTLKSEGYTYRQIGKMLGVGQGSITKALKKFAQKGTPSGD